MLDLTRVNNARTSSSCAALAGKIRACNRKYGYNGWLGIAQIWISGDHITQGIVKLNDSYFSTSTYNSPAWRGLVMCQEIAHAFGLDHQDEVFDNRNLGSCMDYTNDPDGGEGGADSNDASNEHPNAHDFEQLEAIYAHLDSTTTIAASAPASSGQGANGNANASGVGDGPPPWARPEAGDTFVEDLGHGQKRITHVFWLPGGAGP